MDQLGIILLARTQITRDMERTFRYEEREGRPWLARLLHRSETPDPVEQPGTQAGEKQSRLATSTPRPACEAR